MRSANLLPTAVFPLQRMRPRSWCGVAADRGAPVDEVMLFTVEWVRHGGRQQRAVPQPLLGEHQGGAQYL